MNIPMMLADSLTTAPTTTPAGAVPWWYNLLHGPFPLLLIGMFFLMMMMGKGGARGEEKKRKEMLKQLKRGDRIQTIGGIQGAVVRAEETRVEVKVDESTNTKIWFARTAIARVLEADKSDAK